MPKFKVILCNENPFKPISIMQSSHKEIIIPAKDEKHVRQLWEDAKHLPKFNGLRLKEIQQT